MTHPCPFCTDLDRAGPIIYQDENAALVLHPDEAVAGHAMVVARRHVQNFTDLKPDEQARFGRIHAAAERALLDVTGCERAVLLKLGIQVPHLHLHIYPVRESLDRAAVMAVIEGRVRESRSPGFAERVREALTRLLN
jgi:diadenosine tetraphosphate (Ap4A) HIT family hydrolase